MSLTENAFLKNRQILLVGLGGVGSRIANTIIKNAPVDRRDYIHAISIDTDLSDLNKLQYIPDSNKIALAASASTGQAMTIGEYLNRNPGAKDWFISGGDCARLLSGISTREGAKQIRMVSRLALSATVKYFDFTHRVTKIINEIQESSGALNSQNLLVMVICSVAGGTGAGTVLQVPMFLEDIIAEHFDRSHVTFQCAMLLPNLFTDTQARGNFGKGMANGYAVLKELKSLNSGKLKRIEYLKDYVEVEMTDDRNKAPFSSVILFDNATMSGGTINGSTDTTHIPNIASCLAEYLYRPLADSATSHLDNTLDAFYATGGNAIFRAVGRSELVYPDTLYKKFTVNKWILSAVSENWILPDIEARKLYLEILKERRNKGLPRPTVLEKNKCYLDIVKDPEVCRGTFFSEIRNQLLDEVIGDDGKVVSSVQLSETFVEGVLENIKEELFKGDNDFTAQQRKVEALFKSDSTDLHTSSFDKMDNAFEDFMSKNGVYVRKIMCPTNSLTTDYLYQRGLPDNSIYSFIRRHSLHPIALRCFLYEVLEKFELEKREQIEYTQENFIDKVRKSSKKDRPTNVKNAMERYLEPFENRLYNDICNKCIKYLKDLLFDVEAVFTDLALITTRLEGVAEGCLSAVDEYENGTRSLIGSRQGMICCWNEVNAQLHDGEDAAAEDAVDTELSNDINVEIYKNYFNWVENKEDTDDDDDGVFRFKPDYASIITNRLLTTFSKRVEANYSKCFPADIIKAAVYEIALAEEFEKHIALNPKFNPKNFKYSVAESEKAYADSAELKKKAAAYLNERIISAVKKGEPMCGPLKALPTERDYLARAVYFDKDILPKKTIPDADSIEGSKEEYDLTQFIEGVSTSKVENLTIEAMPVDNISKYQFTVFSYTGGLLLSDFMYMQDPTSNEYVATDGHCYYNAYRNYISKVINTQLTNITPHLHKNWHKADKLEDISDEHTDSKCVHTAKAFVYGFMFDDVIRIKSDGSVQFGLLKNRFFTGLGNGVDGIITYYPFNKTEHARFKSKDKAGTNRVLFEIFRYLMDYPQLRTQIIAYGDSVIETAKAQKTGKVFRFCITEENCAGVEYKTIIDVIDGFYQHARFTDMHDTVGSDVKAISAMFDAVCRPVIDVCFAIFPTDAARLEKFSYFVDKLYEQADCDDIVTVKKGVKDEEIADIFTDMPISAEELDLEKPFSDKGNFSKKAMISVMENELDKE